ncbi:MAG: permease-like cell division protein FtsX [candidate division Zixibacteria bacterium]|nr:permease-like cell division protein FtsX [candidate division Zixibacteria bacterium]
MSPRSFSRRSAGLRRNLASNAGTIFVTGLIFLLLGMVVLITENFRSYNRQIKAELEFEVYLSDDTTPIELYLLTIAIRDVPGFNALRLQDRSEAYAQMQELLGKELLPNGGFNPFPNTIVVDFTEKTSTLAAFGAAAEELATFRCIENINYGEEWLLTQEPLFAFLNLCSTSLALLVFAATVILVFWAVSKIVYSRQEEIKALLMHGAGFRQIGIPLILEGCALGTLGAILGELLLVLLWQASCQLPLQLAFISTTSMVAIPLSGFFSGITAGYLVVTRRILP